MESLIRIESTRSKGGWVAWWLLGVWLAAVVLVLPAGAEEFSLMRCLGGGFGQIDTARHFACYEVQREYEANRYREAAERERLRRATEEATRQQEAEAQAQAQAREAADRAAKARQEAERARRAEEVERARKAEAERARKAAEEVDAARLQENQRRRAAEQFMPGMCPLGDLSAKCAMASPDPVVEQIRRSQENAARGRPSR
jgi:hypothetical protein